MGTKTQEYLAALAGEGELPEAGCCMTTAQSLIYDAAVRVNNLDEEVQELKNNPDVVDIVATYQDLQDYDTDTLTDKDIIRVLSDSTHNGNSTFYRYDESTGSWTLIGEISGNPTTIQVSGSTPTIVASPDTQYLCGTVTTLDVTLPSTRLVDIVFTSGATPTTLTITPPAGQTLRWAGDFDPTALEANTTYELNVLNGTLGVAASWA